MARGHCIKRLKKYRVGVYDPKRPWTQPVSEIGKGTARTQYTGFNRNEEFNARKDVDKPRINKLGDSMGKMFRVNRNAGNSCPV